MKPVHWVGSSREALTSFPIEVKRDIGFAFDKARRSDKHPSAKPQGFGGASVLEIVVNYDGDTYRAVYTVRCAEVVYVPHCFRKKSKRDIKTPKKELDLIAARLKKPKRITSDG